MNRTEQFKSQNFQAEEWQKLFYKYQQQYIRKRLEAIKYLHEGQTRQYDILKEIGLSHQKAHRDYENGDLEAQREFVTTLKKNWQTSSLTRG